MILSFLESIRYSGNLLPLSLLRIFLGYYFFSQGLTRIETNFLIEPHLAALVSQGLTTSTGPEWLKLFFESFVIPQWRLVAYVLVYCEFLIGISFLIGFLVRPVALVGLLISVLSFYSLGDPIREVYLLKIVLFVIMFWMGAGRCLGFDYFFYKRQRGLWW
jgi:thiosulfate dehydrogenase [quinone] large subunit